MSILSVALLMVLSAHMCAGLQPARLFNLKDRTNPLASIMLDELIRRATNGFTPTVAVSRNPMLPSTVFSPTGFFYLSSAVDADCSEPLLEFGVEVDACIWTENFSLKLQVPLAGTCEGAVVEYYLDEACTVYAGTSPVESADTVCKNTGSPFATGLVHSQLNCTLDITNHNRHMGCAYELWWLLCDDSSYRKFAYLRTNDARCMGPYHAPNAVPKTLEYYTQVTSCTEEECPYPTPSRRPADYPFALPSVQPC